MAEVLLFLSQGSVTEIALWALQSCLPFFHVMGFLAGHTSETLTCEHPGGLSSSKWHESTNTVWQPPGTLCALLHPSSICCHKYTMSARPSALGKGLQWSARSQVPEHCLEPAAAYLFWETNVTKKLHSNSQFLNLF